MLRPILTDLVGIPLFGAAIGGAIFLQGQPTYPSGDVVINFGVLLALIVSVVGALTGAVTFLFKMNATASKDMLERVEKMHTDRINEQEEMYERLVVDLRARYAEQHAEYTALVSRLAGISDETLKINRLLIDKGTEVIKAGA